MNYIKRQGETTPCIREDTQKIISTTKKASALISNLGWFTHPSPFFKIKGIEIYIFFCHGHFERKWIQIIKQMKKEIKGERGRISK